jgi:hypothetical protein
MNDTRGVLKRPILTQVRLGGDVTLKWTTCRRSWRSTTKPSSKRKVAVGTTKKSMLANELNWLSRNERHVGDGGRRCHISR